MRTWLSTVFLLRKSAAAISALVLRSTISRATSSSRSVSVATASPWRAPGRLRRYGPVTLDKRVTATLPAHIHTGPCSDEPTMRNPRIWAGLTEVIDGRSESVVTVATLDELRAEGASLNVHDPHHDLRPMVCGDITG